MKTPDIRIPERDIHERQWNSLVGYPPFYLIVLGELKLCSGNLGKSKNMFLQIKMYFCQNLKNRMTHSEENYLKAIYHLSKSGESAVSTNAIARQIETKPSSVTDMVRRLSEKGLVHYKKYQGVTLSEGGRQKALMVIRKHRLWEVFLVERLEFSWDEVHEVAEQLEHIKSEKLIDKIDELLDFPKFDPHGDPIPGKDGLLPAGDKQLLSNLPINSKGICVGVKDSSSSFLRFLDKNHIALGNNIEVMEREEFDNSISVVVEGRPIHLSHLIAANLYIKKI